MLRKNGFDLGMLILRVSAGLFMIYGHGWVKVTRWETLSKQFLDLFGLGSGISLALAIFAEVVCAAAVALGLFTRVAVIPLIVTMLVAALIHHGADPFGKKELALLYAAVFAMIGLAGAGRFSLDRVVRGKR